MCYSCVSSSFSNNIGPGGYSMEFSVGVCCPVLQIPTLFQTKMCHFPDPFLDLAFKIHICFQTCRGQEWVKFTQKFSSNDVFWILFFLYYSFGVEKTNTFIRSRGSLYNHTRFKITMVKIYTRFHTKTAQKPYPLGQHIPI